MSEKKYELVVIGGGPGGYVAAIRAAQLGFRVAVVEGRQSLGGTCLNVGCIPSKALLASTESFRFAQENFAAHGIMSKDLRVDLSVMMERKNKIVAQLGKGIDGLMKKNKIERVAGWARLLDAHTVEVALLEGDTERLEAENIIIATGSESIELPFLPCDGKKVITSDQAIALPKVPETMAVIGGGAIGLELASVWNRLGSQVTIIEFLPHIVAGFDEEISRQAQRLLERQGLKIHTSTRVESGKVGEKKVELITSHEGQSQSIEAEVVLVAIGRRPFTKGLGAEAVGLAMTERGCIQINERWQSNVPSIYAIGDVVEGPMLAHKAEEEGVGVAEVLAGKPGHANSDVIPNVVYTSPEIASVGLSEQEAKKKGIEYRIGKFSFLGNGRALANDCAEGLVKVITCAQTDRVLGVQMLGHQASEMIAEAVLLMEFSGSAEDLARTVHAHPTMSEAMKEAALAVEKRAIHG